MIIAAIIFFTLAALFGILLLTFVLRGKQTPKAVTFTHGPLAATGLILLIIYSLQNHPAPIASLILFATAAIGGLVLITLDLTRAAVPKWLALLHGGIAVTGFVWLLLFMF